MAGWGRCRRCGEDIWWGANPDGSGRAFPFDDDDEDQSHFESCAAQEWVRDDAGERHSVGHCRACDARVWWQTTRSGKRRPMDVDGSVASWECHFDTCRARATDDARAADREAADRARRTRYASPLAPYEVRLWLPDLEMTWPCTFAAVTSGFRQLAMRHHPDLGGQASEFIRIRLAYDALKKYADRFPTEVPV